MKRKDNNSGFFLFWRGAIMQLKITTDYAIRIVYYLACRGEVITASELAYELKIPESYIPKITKKLKEANIITACEGICGYSPEYQCGFTCWFLYRNAWKEAEKEILALYGKRSYMYQEVKEMNCSISLNQPLELLLGDFSTRSGNMDIASFSEVFSFAKRSGGNFVTIIDATSRHMRVRHETEREIQVQIAF